MRYFLPLIAVLFFAAGVPVVHAQGDIVQNVRFEPAEGNRVFILYDLVGPRKARYDVQAFFSQDGGQTFQPISAVSGHVGADVRPGTAHTIVWLPLSDFPEGFSGDNIVFRVTANLTDEGGGSNSLLYIIGGAVVAGAGTTVALLLGGSGDDGNGNGNGNGNTGLPDPPARPSGN